MSWDIRGCSGKCVRCSKNFIDGEFFWCRLFLEEAGPRREDYCKDCWENREDLQKGYSSWNGRYRIEPIKREEEPIKEPISKLILKKYLNSAERLHQCLCYILAILLERNKAFQPRPSVNGCIVYEDKETGETYILNDPNLTIKELSEIEGQLSEMFKQELTAA